MGAHWYAFLESSELLHIFRFASGKEDLFNLVLDKCAGGQGPIGLELLKYVVRFPEQLFCGQLEKVAGACCFAHIVKHFAPQDWLQKCRDLEDTLIRRLGEKPGENMVPEKVIQQLQEVADPPLQYEEAMKWLTQWLPVACQCDDPNPSALASADDVKDDLVKDVAMVAWKYTEVSQRCFRPVQLASILLNVRSAELGSSILVEMKTGEGKTDTCAAVAATLARRHPERAIHIVTSSCDRAEDDRKATTDFLLACTGQKPKLASEGLKWGAGEGGEGIYYAQVTDIQKLVVDEMRNSKHKLLFKWLAECHLLVDEVDHVLIEQSENQLFISSPCRGFQALAPLLFLVVAYMDFHADFAEAQVKDTSALPERSSVLAKKMLEDLHKFEGKGDKGRWKHMAPVKVDTEAYIASLASGSLAARMKSAGREFVIDVQEEHGMKVLKVVHGVCRHQVDQ